MLTGSCRHIMPQEVRGMRLILVWQHCTCTCMSMLACLLVCLDYGLTAFCKVHLEGNQDDSFAVFTETYSQIIKSML